MRTIAFRREYVELTGSITAALMLSQAIYWTQRTDDGWFYKSLADWYAETGMKRREQGGARKRLNQHGWWAEDRHGPRGTVRFRVDIKLLDAEIQNAQNVQPTMHETYNLNNLECTKRTTYNARNVQPDANQNVQNVQPPYTESTLHRLQQREGTVRATPQPTKPKAETPPTPTATSEKVIRHRKTVRINSPHLASAKFVEGYIPAGDGKNPVQVYYERFEINHDQARLNPPQEDDLVYNCPDLLRLREVITAYGRTNYRPGNLQLILDWYRDGVPVKNQNGNGPSVTQNPTVEVSWKEITLG